MSIIPLEKLDVLHEPRDGASLISRFHTVKHFLPHEAGLYDRAVDFELNSGGTKGSSGKLKLERKSKMGLAFAASTLRDIYIYFTQQKIEDGSRVVQEIAAVLDIEI